jgi:very-short-patch-repair endonuclease
MNYTSNQFIERARKLRKESTPAERLLWSALRNVAFAGLKFRRQHPVGFYVADFCCLKEKLIIELDGDSHDFTEQKDKERTEALNNEGYRVIRFANADVFDNLENVLKMIARTLDADWATVFGNSNSPHPNPLPEGEGTTNMKPLPLGEGNLTSPPPLGEG